MSSIPDEALESFRESGYYVLGIPPYHGKSFAIVPEDELDNPDDFDLNNMEKYDGFVIEPL